MEAPSIHPKLAATLAAFCEAGISLTDAEVCWLYDLRRHCDKPADGSLPWLSGAAFEYAGERFYPLHRLGWSWFSRAIKLLDSEEWNVQVYLFAHARSGHGDTSLRQYVTEQAIRDAVEPWYDGLAIHDDCLPDLCDRLQELDGESTSVPDPDAKDKQAPDEGDQSAAFVAAMCKAFPCATPDYWLTEISLHDAMRMIDSLDSHTFATSEKRRESISNYLKAVKWLWRKYSNG